MNTVSRSYSGRIDDLPLGITRSLHVTRLVTVINELRGAGRDIRNSQNAPYGAEREAVVEFGGRTYQDLKCRRQV